uniref:DUF1360 domain-containing protein n=1 Tax=Myoviridae sp. ctPuP5 TaxID=2823543 RepID=A0A8S5L9Y3_9CAUD|nr:MAG TPA: Protein of unknown function DUF1360 [Myoviridae sp. ctPuP5]
MSWLVFIIYMFTAYGITNMLVYLRGPLGIFEYIREIANKIHSNLGELFSCMACCSTWIGLFFSLINLLIIPSIALTPAFLILGTTTNLWWVKLIIDMACTSGFVWIMHNFEEMTERIYNNE